MIKLNFLLQYLRKGWVIMRKLLKNQKGFTLVEVIVVAVIVAILAAVAIPLYNGYIKQTKTDMCTNAAGAAASYASAAYNFAGNIDPIVDPATGGLIGGPLGATWVPPTGYAVSVDGATGTVKVTAPTGENASRAFR